MTGTYLRHCHKQKVHAYRIWHIETPKWISCIKCQMTSSQSTCSFCAAKGADTPSPSPSWVHHKTVPEPLPLRGWNDAYETLDKKIDGRTRLGGPCRQNEDRSWLVYRLCYLLRYHTHQLIKCYNQNHMSRSQTPTSDYALRSAMSSPLFMTLSHFGSINSSARYGHLSESCCLFSIVKPNPKYAHLETVSI